MGGSIQELTSGIKALGESGGLELHGDDLKMCNDYINTFRGQLLAEKNKIPALKNFHGSAGNYPSGEQTKITLIDDTESIEKLLDGYLAYLDAFQQAVNKSVGGLIANG